MEYDREDSVSSYFYPCTSYVSFEFGDAVEHIQRYTVSATKHARSGRNVTPSVLLLTAYLISFRLNEILRLAEIADNAVLYFR